MNTFDTLKFSFPFTLVKRLAVKFFNYTKTTSENFVIMSEYLHLKGTIPGLSYIHIDKIKNTVCIEVSAKILIQKYKDLINKENFIEVLEKILETDFIFFNKNEVLKHLKFHRVDLTKNIYVENNMTEFINFLSFLCNSKKINVQRYKDESVTFCYNPLSKRRRIRSIFYNKYNELKKDKNFCELVDIENYKNFLRYEMNLNNYFLLRKFFDLDKFQDLNYQNIICSEKNPLLENLLLISNCSLIPSFKIDIYDSEISLNEIEKYLGAGQICKSFDYDVHRISIFLKSKVKGNISRYINYYRYICSQNKKISDLKTQNSFLNLIYKNVA